MQSRVVIYKDGKYQCTSVGRLLSLCLQRTLARAARGRDVAVNPLSEFPDARAFLRTGKHAGNAPGIQWRRRLSRRLGVYGVLNFKPRRVCALVLFLM